MHYPIYRAYGGDELQNELNYIEECMDYLYDRRDQMSERKFQKDIAELKMYKNMAINKVLEEELLGDK